MKYKSKAQWPAIVAACHGASMTEDTHDTYEQARAVCDMLEREGLGGDREIFPVSTWVEQSPNDQAERSWFGELCGRRFGCLLIDPPWKYDNESPPCLPEKQPETCVVEYYYPTMGLDEIKAMPVKDVAEKDSVMFLWATCPMLPEAIEVMKAWGWKYKTVVTWEKTNGDCMGYWFRTCTEHLLVGVRGNVKSFRSMTRNLIQCNRGRHSAKPQQAHDIIESVTPDTNRLEIFARLHRPGWTAWGNQVERDLYSPNDKVSDPRQ